MHQHLQDLCSLAHLTSILRKAEPLNYMKKSYDLVDTYRADSLRWIPAFGREFSRCYIVNSGMKYRNADLKFFLIVSFIKRDFLIVITNLSIVVNVWMEYFCQKSDIGFQFKAF